MKHVTANKHLQTETNCLDMYKSKKTCECLPKHLLVLYDSVLASFVCCLTLSLLTELPASLGLLHNGIKLIHLMDHLCCICQGKSNLWRESHDR